MSCVYNFSNVYGFYDLPLVSSLIICSLQSLDQIMCKQLEENKNEVSLVILLVIICFISHRLWALLNFMGIFSLKLHMCI